MKAHVRWVKGGEAQVVSLADDAIVLLSTAPSPPGSRFEGTLEGPRPPRVRVKVHSSKKQPGGEFPAGGRSLDATRDVRERLGQLAGEGAG